MCRYLFEKKKIYYAELIISDSKPLCDHVMCARVFFNQILVAFSVEINLQLRATAGFRFSIVTYFAGFPVRFIYI